MTFISYAQNNEDAVLNRALSDIADGFYVDVGAHHPVVDSVTHAFYSKGWRGINIDPLPRWIDLYEAHRPGDTNLCLFASDSAGITPFFELGDAGGLSTGSQAAAEEFSETCDVSVTPRSVPSLTLTQILGSVEHRDIHFLKVDVEGAEKEVLSGLDFTRYRPWIVLVEATVPNKQIENHHGWEHILLSNQYSHVFSDGLNRFYLCHSQSNREEFFRFPVSIFDQVIPAQLSELHWRIIERLKHINPSSAKRLQHPADVNSMLANISHAFDAIELVTEHRERIAATNDHHVTDAS